MCCGRTRRQLKRLRSLMIRDRPCLWFLPLFPLHGRRYPGAIVAFVVSFAVAVVARYERDEVFKRLGPDRACRHVRIDAALHTPRREEAVHG